MHTTVEGDDLAFSPFPMVAMQAFRVKKKKPASGVSKDIPYKPFHLSSPPTIMEVCDTVASSTG